MHVQESGSPPGRGGGGLHGPHGGGDGAAYGPGRRPAGGMGGGLDELEAGGPLGPAGRFDGA